MTVQSAAPDGLYWSNIIWLSLVHTAGAFGAWHLATAFSWETATVAVVLFLLCHLSITGGYHRLYTHAAYKAKAALQVFYLIFGAAAFQGSAKWWAGVHQLHHKKADTDGDPHSITRGFFFAHMGWLFRKSVMYARERVKNLAGNAYVHWQHRWYRPISVITGLGVPTALCALWGDWLGGLLVAGFLRLVFQYHGTWLVNSQSHYFGKRVFDGGTARSAPLIGLLCNVGEGVHHDFHHAYPFDWRLEPKISWFNPGTWFVWVCAKLKLAWGLREATPEQIARAYLARKAPAAT